MATKKQILFNEQVWEKLISGCDKIAKAVGATLGPNGNTVIIERAYGDPKVTKDGVTVAKEISVEDPFENLGIKTLSGIANRMSVGDGTTSSIVFSHALLVGSRKLIAAGMNAGQIIAGIEKGVKAVLKLVEENTQAIEDKMDMIKEVATISANGDQNIGSMIADAFKKVGKNGVISVEESKTGVTEVAVVNGMQLDKGYCSPYFITNPEKGLCELNDAFILLYDGKISTIQPIVKMLEAVVKQGKALLIIAEDVDGEALSALVLNKLHGKLKVAAVKAPSFGDRRKEIMQDIAIMTGGQLISPELNMTLEDANPMCLGHANKIIITKEHTILSECKGEKTNIQSRVNQLEVMQNASESEYDRTKYSERIANLLQGVAVIKVGGHSSLAIGELKDRIDDAVSAVKAAAKKGIVPGGGALFVHAAKYLNENCSCDNDVQKAGMKVLCDALLSITRRIVSNSGIEHYESIVQKVYENTDMEYGYDARECRFGNMKQFGVVDAALVLESVLNNGFDGVKTLISTSVMIADIPEPKEAAVPAGGMGDYY